jgi:hypothetical protein
MSTSTEVFYSSSNGDRWQLITDAETGHHVVRHEPNLSSGGKAFEVDVVEFLSRSANTPQGEALQALLDKQGAGYMEDE